MKKIFVILLLFTSVDFIHSQWIQLNSPVNEFLDNVSFFDENTGVIVANNKALFTSNGGTNWIISTPTGYTLRDVLCLNPGTAFVVGDSGYVLKSTNCGLNWQIIRTDSNYKMNSLSFINLNTGFIVGNFSGILISTNGGLNWSKRAGPNPGFTVWFTSPDTGYYGGNYRYSTTNQGVFWMPWTPQQGHTYSFYKIHGTSPANVWTLWYDSWWTPQPIQFHEYWNILGSSYSHSFTDVLANMFVVSTQKAFIVGGSVGYGKIFRTIDGGTTIELQKNTSNAMYGIWMINENTGYAVGMSGLIYKTTNGGVTGLINNGNQIPEKYSLFQNYPNPFNPTTNIRYQIANNKFVILKIFDLIGKEIETLVNEQQSPGTYDIQWDARRGGYPSGVYFYRLKVIDPLRHTEDFIETKKMILIK